MAYYEMDVHTACAMNQSDVVMRLLNRDGLIMGSKENSKGYTPLMYACCYGHEDIVKLLIDMKVPIQYQSKKCHGRTALMVAANLENLTILNMVCKDFVVNIQDMNGWTALHHAVSAGQLHAAKFLISKGIDIDARTCNGMTALMMSAEDGMTVIADLLLTNGADPHIVNNNNETAYTIAYNRNQAGILQLLQSDPSQDLLALLTVLQLDKYWPVFKKHNIDFHQFMTLTEDHLKNIGIIPLGHRRKLALAIFELNHNMEALCNKFALPCQ
nr:PREDICTED: ankyrin repeat and SAM domain-containing protein 3-like [Bemisia tabaci]